LPAGTANLLAHNLGIPQDIAKAVHIGLHGRRRKMDVGTMNGERFTVMAGTGFDAAMIGGVDRPAKKRLGRMAYLRSAAKAMKIRRFPVTIRVDGAAWWKGMASTVLVGNVGKVMGGVTLFPGASPSDGFLDVGVVTASTRWQWLRVFSRLAAGHLERSPFIERTRGKRITVELDRKRPYEIDGSVRPATKRLKVRLEAEAITLCLPAVRAATRAKKPRKAVTPARIAPLPAAVPIAPAAVPVEPQPNGTGPRTTPDRP
jgi:diacylglycerol kinase family enzyme